MGEPVPGEKCDEIYREPDSTPITTIAEIADDEVQPTTIMSVKSVNKRIMEKIHDIKPGQEETKDPKVFARMFGGDTNKTERHKIGDLPDDDTIVRPENIDVLWDDAEARAGKSSDILKMIQKDMYGGGDVGGEWEDLSDGGEGSSDIKKVRVQRK